MTHLLGVTHVDRFTVLDGEGTPILGAQFTADAVFGPNDSSFDWTLVERGAGLYEASWVLNAVGTYYLRLVTSDVPGFDLSVYELQKITDDIEIGEEVLNYFTVRDDDGVYATNVPISVDVAIGPNGDSFTPIIEPLPTGLYRVRWAPLAEGVYSTRLSADLSALDDDPQFFEFEIRAVAPLSQPSALLPVHGSSLDDLVRAVALLCRDLRDTVATADAANALTWNALDLSAVAAKTIKGANLFIVSATLDVNVGMESLVGDSIPAGLALVNPLPTPPKRGDRAYLTNLESSGFLRQTYVNAINDQIANAWPIHLVRAQWTFGVDELTPDEQTAALFNPDLPYVVPPPEFTHLSGVSYPTPGYAPYETHIPFDDKDRAGWWWDGANNRVVIGGGYRQVAAGMPIQLRGYGAAPRLEGNTAQTSVPRRWLTEMTAGALIWSLRDPRRQSEAQNHVNRADAWLPELTTMVEPGTVKIR